jgi:hypothetical protein
MLKKTWEHLIRTPAGLDPDDRLYVWGNYLTCALLALCGLIMFVSSAISLETTLAERFMLAGLGLAIIAAAYALRWFVYWMHTMKIQLLRFIRSKMS